MPEFDQPRLAQEQRENEEEGESGNFGGKRMRNSRHPCLGFAHHRR
jgi:hypothetical protein